jgi:hypothetical protein
MDDLTTEDIIDEAMRRYPNGPPSELPALVEMSDAVLAAVLAARLDAVMSDAADYGLDRNLRT